MLRNGTGFDFDYRYSGTWYQGTVRYSSGTVTIEVGSAGHLYGSIYYYY